MWRRRKKAKIFYLKVLETMNLVACKIFYVKSIGSLKVLETSKWKIPGKLRILWIDILCEIVRETWSLQHWRVKNSRYFTWNRLGDLKSSTLASENSRYFTWNRSGDLKSSTLASKNYRYFTWNRSGHLKSSTLASENSRNFTWKLSGRLNTWQVKNSWKTMNLVAL